MQQDPPERPFERRRWRPSRFAIALSLLSLAGLVFATLCPINLRPHFADANVERFGAYAVLGLILSQTMRRRPILVAFIVVLIAVALEFGQLFVPGRDARVQDAMFKAAGGLFGTIIGYGSFAGFRLMKRLNVMPAEGHLTLH